VEGLLAVVGLEVTTEGVRTGTGTGGKGKGTGGNERKGRGHPLPPIFWPSAAPAYEQIANAMSPDDQDVISVVSSTDLAGCQLGMWSYTLASIWDWMAGHVDDRVSCSQHALMHGTRY